MTLPITKCFLSNCTHRVLRPNYRMNHQRLLLHASYLIALIEYCDILEISARLDVGHVGFLSNCTHRVLRHCIDAVCSVEAEIVFLSNCTHRVLRRFCSCYDSRWSTINFLSNCTHRVLRLCGARGAGGACGASFLSNCTHRLLRHPFCRMPHPSSRLLLI